MSDFMFELTEDEVAALVSQSVIPSRKQLGGAKPLAFTEQGVSSLSAVLTSTRGLRLDCQGALQARTCGLAFRQCGRGDVSSV